MIIVAPASLSLRFAFSIATGILKKLLKTTGNKNKNENNKIKK